MGKTKIEWTEQTWNPIVGCTIVSPGCTNCYAMKMAARLSKIASTPQYHGTIQQSRKGPVWTGKVALAEKALLAPLKRKKPTMYFVNSMGDLFHEDVPDEWIDRVFAVMALCPQHTFQCLTKRSSRMRDYMLERWQGHAAMELAGLSIPAGPETGRRHQVAASAEYIADDLNLCDPNNDALYDEKERCIAMTFDWPLPNVWLGISVEDQTRADERIPALLDTPAAIRFVSAEPLLGQLYLDTYLCAADPFADGDVRPSLDWIICGGESGPNARPMHPDWARGLRDQCEAVGVAYFFKQWGECLHESQDPNLLWNWSDAEERNALHYWPDGSGSIRVGKKAAGAELDGREWKGMPNG